MGLFAFERRCPFLRAPMILQRKILYVIFNINYMLLAPL